MKQILTTVVLFFATVCMAQAPLVDTVATSRILPLTNTDRISPLAEAIGVSRQTINAIETGKFVPSTVLAIKIARLFRKPVEEIFSLDNDE